MDAHHISSPRRGVVDAVFGFAIVVMEPSVGIEPTTSSLPMTCSTTELQGQLKSRSGARSQSVSTGTLRGTTPYFAIYENPWAAQSRHVTERAWGGLLQPTGPGDRDCI